MRARNIKPGFFKNEELLECSFQARLLYIGLWCLADRDGRMEHRPKRYKIELFPADDVDVESMVQELCSHGFVRLYAVDGREYLDIPTFTKNQNPHVKEASLHIPAFENRENNIVLPCPDASTVQARCKHDASPAESLLLNPESGILIPDPSEPAAEDAPLDPEPLPEFDQTRNGEYSEWERLVAESWNKLPSPPFRRINKITKERREHLKVRYGEQEFRQAFTAIILAIERSSFLRGSGPQGWIADFDWLIKNGQNYTKILEGKYDDRKNGQTNGTPRGFAGGAGTNTRDRSITRSIPDFARNRLVAIADLGERVAEAERLGVIPDRATADEVRALV